MSHSRSVRARAAALLGTGTLLVAGGLAGLAPGGASASSHREAPGILGQPQYDNTDVYAFVSPDRGSTVTLVANWIPLEEPAGGPNFYPWATDARYEIHIDNNGDAKADLTYRWTFRNSRTPGPADSFSGNAHGHPHALDQVPPQLRRVGAATDPPTHSGRLGLERRADLAPSPHAHRVCGSAREAAPTEAHRRPHEHAQPPEHPHPHGGPSRRGLVAMGLAGGLLPSPSALVVFLGALALGHPWFGVLLVVFFGLGMALTLGVVGLAVLRLRATVEQRFAGRAGSRLATVVRLVPVLTAVCIVTLGLSVALKGISGVGG